ncbi:MAG: hypothetical protein HPY45_03650 [Anaerolineae bacterium]|nr:hypothetical protein [Anaerolineae bacterium]
MEIQETPQPVQLSEGKPQPQEITSLPAASGIPLSEDEIQALLSRLPEIEVEAEDRVEFRLPTEPIPPPRTGDTINEPFPPPAPSATPSQTVAEPLQVVRYAPEGEISIAPFISVTFNQPMISIATLANLAEKDVPVQISPSLPGTWRWLGTKTLTFEYDSESIDRLPKATKFLVSVPAGTKSVIGGTLQKTVSWEFTTPPPKIAVSHPNNQSQPRDPVFFIEFDQRINPESILQRLSVTASGQPVGIRPASETEIQADKQVSALVKRALEGRWLAFKAKELLPANSQIDVVIPAGTPSAEGPLTTQEEQTFSFQTYAPLSVVQHGCSWYGDNCPPLTPFYIEFNNPIDANVFKDSLLSIKPEISDATFTVYGNTINIQGSTRGKTTYTVIVNKNIRDVFGQTMAEDKRLSFRVGSAEPALVGPEQSFVTLDPASSKPVFSVYTINYNRLKLKIYSVQPENWSDFKNYLQNYRRTEEKLTLPGKLILEKTLRLDAPDDTLYQVDIDLSEVVNDGYGQFIVVVEPPESFLFQQYPSWQTVYTWVQVTQIALDAFNDHSQMVVWTTALKDGSPLSDVIVQAGKADKAYMTNKDGIARFAIPDNTEYLIARKGKDVALLPRSTYLWGNDNWSSRPVIDELRWYVFDDRQMYKPGEEIHVKGWLRRIGGKQDGDVSWKGNEATTIYYKIIESQGNELGSGETQINAFGGFDFAFTIPEQVNLGNSQIYMQAMGGSEMLNGLEYIHTFQIQEFRRPEFEVTARNETNPPYFAGDYAITVVEAKYYAGGPLPDAEVTWEVTSSPGNYQPPGWPDFTFGYWSPWWVSEIDSSETTTETFTGRTDASGAHYLRLDFNKIIQPRPLSISAEATVMDVNRQAWTATTSLLVHPADLYIGLRSERYFVSRGDPLEVDFIVTDIDGKPVSDRPVEIRSALLQWKYQDGSWKEIETDIQTCKKGSDQEPVSCIFETLKGGRYRISAVVTDLQGRKNQSQITRWVSGGEQPPSRKVEMESVTLIPDQENYKPGDVAHILVQSPFTPAEGLLTVSRSGIVYTKHFRIDQESTTLDIPIEDKHIPNLNIQVDLTGAAPRTDDKGEVIKDAPLRPAYASGSLTLNIPPRQRTLSLEITPAQSELEPGGETSVRALLKDASGKPVANAEIAVVVVDEAILALSNYALSDPISIFYAPRPADVTSLYGRSSILLIDPQALIEAVRAKQEVEAQERYAMGTAMPMMMPAAPMDMAGMAESTPPSPTTPIRVRFDFNPLAAFAPVIHTDASGLANVPIKLPDNLTRYRIMAVAVDDARQFGIGESTITARLPLMVRPSAPRFLNFGDQFELPVVLQNQTDAPLNVDVALRASNLDLTGSRGLRVTVPARDRVEVRFPAAAQMAGTARFQVAAASGSYADAAMIELPVYTPATTEAFATYGTVDQGAISQPIAAMNDIFPQYGGLEITTSSTALQALTDAVLYLVAYPYECSEQLASRILAIAALRDVLTAFKAEGLPSPQEMEDAVQRDVNRLQSMQNQDGGIPYWRRGQESIPFHTIHVAHALQRAEQKGFQVPQEMKTSLLNYLRHIEDYYPYWYSKQTRWTLSAYTLYVRQLMNDSDPQKAQLLLNEAGLENLRLDAVGWLWVVLENYPEASSDLNAIRRHVANRVVETAASANFVTEYDEQNYLLLSSDRRTDAILLNALMSDNPNSDLIPKLVNGLLAHRTRGRWGNTQENVFVLLALDKYFNTYEAQTPDFVARIWLGDSYAGDHAYRGRTTERHQTDIPMSYLLENMPADGVTHLILSKEGAGRLYYRLGLRYAPTSLKMDALDMGFVVQRTYEAVDAPQDVQLDENGIWHIRAGARVRVRIQMVADNRRYHVALADPIPAGLEIVNPLLAVSGSIPQDPNSSDYQSGWWWWRPWFDHQNLRDERAEAFTPLLWDGVYQYTYLARATTPGRFIVPPAKAEEMYTPEVFGRSSSDVVIVE